MIFLFEKKKQSLGDSPLKGAWNSVCLTAYNQCSTYTCVGKGEWYGLRFSYCKL